MAELDYLEEDDAEALVERLGLAEFDPDRGELYYAKGDVSFDGNWVQSDGDYLIVEGNLTINGALIGHFVNYDDMSMIYVTGNLVCDRLIVGSCFDIGGDLQVRDWSLFVGNNLDAFKIKGKLIAPCIIDEYNRELHAAEWQVDKVISFDPSSDFACPPQGTHVVPLAAEHFVAPEAVLIGDDQQLDWAEVQALAESGGPLLKA